MTDRSTIIEQMRIERKAHQGKPSDLTVAVAREHKEEHRAKKEGVGRRRYRTYLYFRMKRQRRERRRRYALGYLPSGIALFIERIQP